MVCVRSPAKLNLCLFVLGKRSDGFHEILSVVQKVELCDLIEIEESYENSVEFRSHWDIPEDNTVSRTLRYISGFTGNFYKVRVIKNIPPGAGLGGASSNAGTVLKKFNIPQMSVIAEKVGSDVPLFLKKTPSLISGRGEIVSEISIEGINSAWFLIVFPNISSITKDVYEKFDSLGISCDTERVSYLRKLVSSGVIKWKDFEFVLGWNDLEFPFLDLYPEAKSVKDFLSRFAKFHLTGSGSSFFSVFFDKKEAKRVYDTLRNRFSFLWLVKAFED